ncbi:MAG: ArsA-related P-loop ATPase [Myxococcota bacterium]|nr:ArsA-related P-loop ATPase [Myxococcota bacterium]
MLGLAAAKRGIRTVIAETYGANRIAPIFQKNPEEYKTVLLEPNLYTISLTASKAIEEYAIMQLKFKRVYKLIFENRFAKPLINAAPGLHEAVQLGKIYSMVEREGWEFIVVDAPATGHGLSMLSSAQTMMDLTKVGPMYESNAIVNELFQDPRKTAVLLVTLLEELPVKETRELWHLLTPTQQRQTRALISNKKMLTPPAGSPSLPLANWQHFTQALLEKESRQKEFCKMLQDLPLSQQSIPHLGAPPNDNWLAHGEILLSLLEDAT